jgi:hypothetical protein
MKRALAIAGCIVIGGALLAATPWLYTLGPLVHALLAVLGFVTFSSLATGAFAALLHAAISPYSFVAGGLAAFALAFVPRAMRARTWPSRAAELGLAIVGAGLGAAIVGAYSSASLPIALAATAVGAILLAAPLVWPIDDPIAYELRFLAASSSGALRRRLARAVVLRRRAPAVHASLAPRTSVRVERAWKVLVRAASDRISGAAAQRDTLDRRIKAYVHSLSRATFAASRANALTQDLDDVVLAELRLERDDLQAKAEALAEVQEPAKSVKAEPIPARVVLTTETLSRSNGIEASSTPSDFEMSAMAGADEFKITGTA